MFISTQGGASFLGHDLIAVVGVTTLIIIVNMIDAEKTPTEVPAC